MSIREIADNIYKVKRIRNEYATKNEYRGYRENLVLEKWENKQETSDERKIRLEKIDFWQIKEGTENIDKKFCKDIDEFVNNHIDSYINKKLINVPVSDISTYVNNRSNIVKDAKKLICNYIISRSTFLLNSKALFVPKCETEQDVNTWFQENCHNFGLLIPFNHRRHTKFNIRGSGSYGGIDYICKFIDTDRVGLVSTSCDNDEFVPQLDKYINNRQKEMYHKFLDFSEADHILIEIEFKSSNFIKHGHPDIVDMIICYIKDNMLEIPILKLSK